MNNNIRALFFDIDGTLVSFSTHRIPDSTVSALEQAKHNGVKIYISTGRPVSLIVNLSQIDSLIDGYVSTNGAYCFVGNDVVSCSSIDRKSTRLNSSHANISYAVFCLKKNELGIFPSLCAVP